MEVYKVAESSRKRVTIIMKLSPNARTNQTRASIVNPETASYRTDSVEVINILDENGTEYAEAISMFRNSSGRVLTYIKGETTKAEDYDPNPDATESRGIHYFLRRSVADSYRREYIGGTIRDRVLCEYHANGRLAEEIPLLNGLRNGICRFWNKDGVLLEEISCSAGKLGKPSV